MSMSMSYVSGRTARASMSWSEMIKPRMVATKGPASHRGESSAVSGACIKGNHNSDCHAAYCTCHCHKSGR
jgi:hypothetical protein